MTAALGGLIEPNVEAVSNSAMSVNANRTATARIEDASVNTLQDALGQRLGRLRTMLSTLARKLPATPNAGVRDGTTLWQATGSTNFQSRLLVGRRAHRAYPASPKAELRRL